MFKIGQKVVYIGSTTLKHGEIYTVTDSVICSCCGKQSISVDNIPESELEPNEYAEVLCDCDNVIVPRTLLGWWDSLGFRPIDHQFGEDIAAQIEEEINEEFLIEVNAL